MVENGLCSFLTVPLSNGYFNIKRYQYIVELIDQSKEKKREEERKIKNLRGKAVRQERRSKEVIRSQRRRRRRGSKLGRKQVIR
jgi:DMSO/TMAO reductase YedYZ molybdopterin-dependent catalytic subunit